MCVFPGVSQSPLMMERGERREQGGVGKGVKAGGTCFYRPLRDGKENENDAPRTRIVNILYQNESLTRQVPSGGENMNPGGTETQSRVHIPPASRHTEQQMRKRKMAAKSQRQTFFSLSLRLHRTEPQRNL